ncbi:hypothetical protein EDB83DRAFT_2312817 [Lactarius deliciosus]|nr:hypothetical protein EDB83DRAFT_2312817 [Lactarius deliciosus]
MGRGWLERKGDHGSKAKPERVRNDRYTRGFGQDGREKDKIKEVGSKRAGEGWKRMGGDNDKLRGMKGKGTPKTREGDSAKSTRLIGQENKAPELSAKVVKTIARGREPRKEQLRVSR